MWLDRRYNMGVIITHDGNRNCIATQWHSPPNFIGHNQIELPAEQGGETGLIKIDGVEMSFDKFSLNIDKFKINGMSYLEFKTSSHVLDDCRIPNLDNSDAPMAFARANTTVNFGRL